MKFYSFKTGNNSSYFDRKEWQKHIRNLEQKTDSLFNYISLINPNYSIVNWNQYNMPTDDQQMQITNDPTRGSVYTYTAGDNSRQYYFLKCFNNNELIWSRKNLWCVNANPWDYINTSDTNSKTWLDYVIDLEDSFRADQYKDIIFEIPENSWLLINSNLDKGYQFLPSSSGFGGIYTIKWVYNYESCQYQLQHNLINNGKDVVVTFFNKPTQTRWNKYDSIGSSNRNYIITAFVDIKNPSGEYYQGQKQVIHKLFYQHNPTTYEAILVDHTIEKNELQEWNKIQFPTNINTDKMGVYYW